MTLAVQRPVSETDAVSGNVLFSGGVVESVAQAATRMTAAMLRDERCLMTVLEGQDW